MSDGNDVTETELVTDDDEEIEVVTDDDEDAEVVTDDEEEAEVVTDGEAEFEADAEEENEGSGDALTSGLFVRDEIAVDDTDSFGESVTESDLGFELLFEGLAPTVSVAVGVRVIDLEAVIVVDDVRVDVIVTEAVGVAEDVDVPDVDGEPLTALESLLV